MLQLTELSFERAHFRLGPITLSLPAGQILRLIGANGTGKTSLMKIVLGQLRPRSGRVQIACPQLGQVGVSALLFDHWTIDSNRVWWEKMAGRKLSSPFRERLETYAHYRSSQLSSGMRRDVEWSLQLGLEFPFYLLDEAFHFLDATRQEFFQSQVRRLRDEKQISFLVSAHRDTEFFCNESEAVYL